MRHNNIVALSAVDTASINGPQIDSIGLVSASFHIYFGDATAAGTVKIQASNDINNARNMAAIDGFVVTNWVDIPNATATIASGAPALITISQLSYGWLRVVYTRSGGGSTTIHVNMDALGF